MSVRTRSSILHLTPPPSSYFPFPTRLPCSIFPSTDTRLTWSDWSFRFKFYRRFDFCPFQLCTRLPLRYLHKTTFHPSSRHGHYCGVENQQGNLHYSTQLLPMDRPTSPPRVVTPTRPSNSPPTRKTTPATRLTPTGTGTSLMFQNYDRD